MFVYGPPVDGQLFMECLAISLRNGKSRVQISWDNSTYYRKGFKLMIEVINNFIH